MKQTLHLTLEGVDFFDTIDAERAEALASRVNGEVYSWKTIGRSNWLERGYKRADVLGLVVLPSRLPDSIDLSEDPDEEGVSFP